MCLLEPSRRSWSCAPLRIQKCADLNQMCTKNLALLFAPSLFQTDGKGEHEVKIMEDLIDHYLHVFDVSSTASTSPSSSSPPPSSPPPLPPVPHFLSGQEVMLTAVISD